MLLRKGYLAHGRRALAGLDSRRVILAPELGGGYGVADLVVGRCLVEVKAAFDPFASIGGWLNQVLGYALLDWSDALGVDTVAVYLGWQALLVSDSLASVLGAATPGPTPSLGSLRADFRTAMQADIDESFAARMRQRYPPSSRPHPKRQRRNANQGKLPENPLLLRLRRGRARMHGTAYASAMSLLGATILTGVATTSVLRDRHRHPRLPGL